MDKDKFILLGDISEDFNNNYYEDEYDENLDNNEDLQLLEYFLSL